MTEQLRELAPAKTPGFRCPYCLDSVHAEDADSVRCARCRTVMHEECWDELGCCGVCKHTVQVEKAPSQAAQTETHEQLAALKLEADFQDWLIRVTAPEYFSELRPQTDLDPAVKVVLENRFALLLAQLYEGRVNSLLTELYELASLPELQKRLTHGSVADPYVRLYLELVHWCFVKAQSHPSITECEGPESLSPKMQLMAVAGLCVASIAFGLTFVLSGGVSIRETVVPILVLLSLALFGAGHFLKQQHPFSFTRVKFSNSMRAHFDESLQGFDELYCFAQRPVNFQG